MKSMLKILVIGLILNIYMVTTVSAQTGLFKDTINHWAKSDINRAVTEGWANGYGDGTFHPDSNITRAEFIKLAAGSIDLNSNSEQGQFYMEASDKFVNEEEAFTDVKNHWIWGQGWMEPAIAFGLVVPKDYYNREYNPDKPITRKEIVVVLDRLLGLVSLAEGDKDAQVSFKDAQSMEKWLRGYVKQAVQNDLIGGYPDGTFKASNNSTRAEAVTMVVRALNKMRQGVDKDIKIYVTDKSGNSSLVDSNADAQVINGIVYVPLKDVLNTGVEKGMKYYWDPIEQSLAYDWIIYHKYIAGQLTYEFNGVYPFNNFPDRIRIQNGELMVPAFYSIEYQNAFNLWSTEWDPAEKEIKIRITTPYEPNPS